MKGKHAAVAATHRLQEALSQVKQLREELVVSRRQARAGEAAVERLAIIQGEMSRLRQQVDDGVSDELIRLRERSQAQLDKAAKDVRTVARILLDRMSEDGMTTEEYETINNIVPLAEVSPDFAKNRDQRRNTHNTTHLAELIKDGARVAHGHRGGIGHSGKHGPLQPEK